MNQNAIFDLKLFRKFSYPLNAQTLNSRECLTNFRHSYTIGWANVNRQWYHPKGISAVCFVANTTQPQHICEPWHENVVLFVSKDTIWRIYASSTLMEESMNTKEISDEIHPQVEQIDRSVTCRFDFIIIHVLSLFVF